jgi:hypothetical protein
VHSTFSCKSLVAGVCPYGHSGLKFCCDEKVNCTKAVTWICMQGHDVFAKCNQRRRADCTICKDLPKAEEELERRNEEMRMEMEAASKTLETSKIELKAEIEQQQSTNELSLINREHELVLRKLKELKSTPQTICEKPLVRGKTAHKKKRDNIKSHAGYWTMPHWSLSCSSKMVMS